ncbi:MAG TPA: response regulator [Epulopiscium sp.]|nr:response regulator [Candidatus Epulonipiscium sp.]
MLKVFLVEDEYIVREGIKKNINWTKEGFIFCGDAPDGEIAYKLIQTQQPDIIITDIKMPFMDGLELSRLVKKELPHSKIIILSGHEEFAYAQEAIKIGVDEYILKPISSVDLMKVVKQVAKEIIREQIERENIKTYKREMQENEIYNKRRFFDKVVGGSLSTAEILERGKELGFEMGAQHYQVILLKYNIRGEDEDYSSELLEINNEMTMLNLKYKDILFFERAIEGDALIVKGTSLEELEEIQKGYLNKIKTIMDSYLEVNYFGGIGVPVSRLTSLFESYESASLAFARRFFVGENDIISNNQMSPLIYGDEDTLRNALDLGNLDTKMAESFLRKGELSEMDFFVEAFLKSIDKASEQSLLLRQYIIMNIYFTAVDFIKEIGKEESLDQEMFSQIDDMKDMIIDFKKLKAFITNIFTFCIKQREEMNTKRYYCVIGQAKKYMEEHYVNEEISLNEVAAHVNISPSYFSTVFRRETGVGFIKYLTSLRMSKARELLKCTDLRSTEISLKVGYKDPQYFSYLFKKEHDMTPMQYRTSKK